MIKLRLGLLFAIAVALAAGLSPALAQRTTPCVDNCNGMVSSGSPSGSGFSYTGPGDIATFAVFWSNSRAYKASTRGGAIINVCNSTGGTDVGCADMVTSATTGILTPATISGISCPGPNCTIKTFYDLTGGGNLCTQATIADRLTLTASQFGAVAGGVASNNSAIYACTAVAESVPWSMYAVSNQPGAGGGSFYDTTIQENGSLFPGLFTNQTSSILEFGCGTGVSVSVTFPNKFAQIGICGTSGTTGSLIVNGSTTSGTTGNTALTTSGYTLHNWRNNAGTYAEGGVFAGDLTSLATTLTTNARSFYGF